MNCQEFELTLRMLVHEDLDVEASELSLAHAQQCAICAKRLVAERALFASVRAVIADLSSKSAPARVETALRSAFRAHVTSDVVAINDRWLQWKSLTSWIWPHWRLVATAATIILISVIAALWFQPKSGVEKPETQAAMVVDGEPDGQPNASARAAPASAPDKVRVLQRPARRKAPVPEVVTEFYPLMEGADLDSLEVVQMVRVELPGSAWRAAGLPVGQDLMNEPVKADVMLGNDGLARAIRFVR